ncbi:hypothetical protein NQ318_016480 [Aromia moschata]|uniref:DUF4817 domain-containing protein n=1 Tax=Aromia moschata TaxID=1265417 RepID=A0AAV8Z470_9CUCU|nr:hypothetical protein NQ318_016480 [Aromia moschata]
MLLVSGFCEGNCRISVEEYWRRFPNRIIPKKRTQDEELILNTIEDEPHISTRNLSRQTGISQTSVLRVIRRNLLHPYHIQNVPELLPEDLLRSEQNCGIALQINVMALETISGYVIGKNRLFRRRIHLCLRENGLILIAEMVFHRHQRRKRCKKRCLVLLRRNMKFMRFKMNKFRVYMRRVYRNIMHDAFLSTLEYMD